MDFPTTETAKNILEKLIISWSPTINNVDGRSLFCQIWDLACDDGNTENVCFEHLNFLLYNIRNKIDVYQNYFITKDEVFDHYLSIIDSYSSVYLEFTISYIQSLHLIYQRIEFIVNKMEGDKEGLAHKAFTKLNLYRKTNARANFFKHQDEFMKLCFPVYSIRTIIYQINLLNSLFISYNFFYNLECTIYYTYVNLYS